MSSDPVGALRSFAAAALSAAHYWDVFDEEGQRILSDLTQPDTRKSDVIHKNKPVFKVSKDGNACSACHRIDAYLAKDEAFPNLEIGTINRIAAGQYDSVSLSDATAPTDSHHAAFMAAIIGGAIEVATAQIAALENCLSNPDILG